MYFSIIKMSHTAREDREFWSRAKDEYSLNLLFRELFSNKSKNESNFVFRQEFGACYPSFFAISENIPEDNTGKWKIISEDYDPLFEAGDKFNFSLRFSPTIIKRKSGLLLRYDCISDALEKRNSDIFTDRKKLKRSDIIKKTAFKWLTLKGSENGFSIDPEYFKADGYTGHKLTNSSGKKIIFNSVECTGKLKVTDYLKFKKALFSGIGDFREFGTGMILIKDLN